MPQQLALEGAAAPLTLRPYQQECLEAIYRFRTTVTAEAPYGGRRALVQMATGLGKALANTEPVLTPSGWKTISNLTTSDLVAGVDGLFHRVLGVFPQGERLLFKVTFTDGATVVCDEEHLWTVSSKHQRRKGRTWKTMSLKELVAEGLKDGLGARHFLPTPQPMEFQAKYLSVDPYTLGALLGDGGLSGWAINLTTEDEIAEAVRVPIGVDRRRVQAVSPGVSTYQFGFEGRWHNPLRGALTELGLMGTYSWNKHIPERYLFASQHQRWALLQGLLDTDGYVDGKGHIEFSTSSPALATDFRFLVQSLGGLVHEQTKVTHYVHHGERRQGRDTHRFTVQLPGDHCPFRLTRKVQRWQPRLKYHPIRAIASVEPIGLGQATCISVDAPGQLFLTRDFVPTHNTVVFARLPKITQRKVLVLAHRDELLSQAQEKIQAANPSVDVEIEQAEQHASRDAKIVVASVQTLAVSPKRLARFRPEDFGIVVVDECHHATSLSYVNILSYFGLAPVVEDLHGSELEKRQLSREVRDRFESFVSPETAPLLVGFTATPTRTDGRGLEYIFDELIFERDMKWGIENRFLCPVRGVRVETHTDISSVKTRAGDFAEKELATAVNTPERNLAAVKAYQEHAAGRRAIWFATDVAHTKALAEMFKREGLRTGYVLGPQSQDRDERRRVIQAFRAGDLEILVNCMVVSEGADIPETSCIGMARPTKSSLLYTQFLGRGLRLSPGKEDCVVIDMVDVAKTAGVSTLNSLFGLPPRFNLKGENVLTAVHAVEDIQEQIALPEEVFAAVQDVKELERIATNLDPLQQAQVEDSIRRATHMNWVKTSFGYALSLLGGGQLGVTVNTLGGAQLKWKVPRESAADMGRFTTSLEALKYAEKWLGQKSPDQTRFLDREARWRKLPPSPKQRDLLMGAGLLVPATRGEASDALDAHWASKRKGGKQWQSV